MKPEQNYTVIDARTAFTAGALGTPASYVLRAQELGMRTLGIADPSIAIWPALERECEAVGIRPMLGVQVEFTHPLDFRQIYTATLFPHDAAGITSVYQLMQYKRHDTASLARHFRGILALASPESIQPILDIYGARNSFLHIAPGVPGVVEEQLRDAAHLDIVPIATNQPWKPNAIVRNAELLSLTLFAKANTMTLPPELFTQFTNSGEMRAILQHMNSPKLNLWMTSFSPEGYMAPEKQMRQIFPPAAHEAIQNTVALARMTEHARLPKPTLPRYPVPEGHTPQGFLRKRCMDNLIKRYKKIPAEVFKRLEYEMEIIGKMGYSDHFLIAGDLAHWLKGNNVPMIGMGSATGSLICYLLEITQVDPIAHGLPFERFLTEATDKIPDIDTAIDISERDALLDHIVRTFPDFGIYPYRISAHPTYGALEALETIMKVFGFDKREISYAKAELRHPAEQTGTYRSLIAAAGQLDGMNIQTGVVSKHPTKVVFSGVPLEDGVMQNGEQLPFLPLTKTEAEQFSNLDFLSNKGLLLIRKLRERLNVSGEIPLDDSQTLSLIFSGKTRDIPYLGTEWLSELLLKFNDLKRYGVRLTIDDLVVAFALSRPAGRPSLELYLRRRSGLASVPKIHPALDAILGSTQGALIFQEQIMQIAQQVALFSPSEAEELRKTISKARNLDRIETLRHAFISRSVRNGISNSIAEKLFNRITEFVEYGFLKGHTIALIEGIAYPCAYFKAHYPDVYMEVLREIQSGPTDDQDKNFQASFSD